MISLIIGLVPEDPLTYRALKFVFQHFYHHTKISLDDHQIALSEERQGLSTKFHQTISIDMYIYRLDGRGGF